MLGSRALVLGDCGNGKGNVKKGASHWSSTKPAVTCFAVPTGGIPFPSRYIRGICGSRGYSCSSSLVTRQYVQKLELSQSEGRSGRRTYRWIHGCTRKASDISQQIIARLKQFYAVENRPCYQCFFNAKLGLNETELDLNGSYGSLCPPHRRRGTPEAILSQSARAA